MFRLTSFLVLGALAASSLTACNTDSENKNSAPTGEEQGIDSPATADRDQSPSTALLDSNAIQGIWLANERIPGVDPKDPLTPGIQLGPFGALDLFMTFGPIGKFYSLVKTKNSNSKASGQADSLVLITSGLPGTPQIRHAFRITSLSANSLVLESAPGARRIYRRGTENDLPVLMGTGTLTGSEEIFKVNIRAAGTFKARVLSSPAGAAFTLLGPSSTNKGDATLEGEPESYATGAAEATVELPAGGEYTLKIQRGRAPNQGPVEAFIQMERVK